MEKKYSIISDPEANVLYQKCRDVDQGLWESLERADPVEVEGRTGARFVGDVLQSAVLEPEISSLSRPSAWSWRTGDHRRSRNFNFA